MIMPRITNQEFVAALKPGQLVRVLSEPGWGRMDLHTRGGDGKCETTEEGELLTFLYSQEKHSFARGQFILQLYFLNMAGMVVCTMDTFKQTTDLSHKLQPVE